ncbi:hypothetical protein [Natronobacterium lacisalsi]|uniref:Uncharacterized protein n=1 Tax=Natronobacterium lacisalsi AJ5 TaxID=358396 RepID=M0LEM3_NATLA|nr:hypothetical protein [Halobiforma lacisalsi]EMA32027.1 hypothetical protein C445_11971 [Halobiforma lacisalsi AJ5]
MHISLRQKAIVATVGVLFALGAVVVFPWALTIIAFAVMIPFFYTVLTA